MARRWTSKVTTGLIVACALLAAAPAGSARDLSRMTGPSVGAARSEWASRFDGELLQPAGNSAKKRSPAAMSAPGEWFLVLFGFILLGAMTRRDTRISLQG
jgi:hypothetical protein